MTSQVNQWLIAATTDWTAILELWAAFIWQLDEASSLLPLPPRPSPRGWLWGFTTAPPRGFALGDFLAEGPWEGVCLEVVLSRLHTLVRNVGIPPNSFVLTAYARAVTGTSHVDKHLGLQPLPDWMSQWQKWWGELYAAAPDTIRERWNAL